MNKEQIIQQLADYWEKRGMPEYDKQWAEEYLNKGHHNEFTHTFYTTKNNSIYSLIRDVSGLVEIRDAIGDYKEILQEVKNQQFRKTIVLVFEEQKNLHEQEGFVCEGVLHNHFKKGETLYLMSLEQ